MKRSRWEPLVAISRLILDVRLAHVDLAAKACEENRARLADLARPSSPSQLPLAVEAQATLRYERWAEARRAEINLALAKSTADWLTARDQARVAFGRAEVLRALAERAEITPQ
jgi:hypothetical protein